MAIGKAFGKIGHKIVHHFKRGNWDPYGLGLVTANRRKRLKQWFRKDRYTGKRIKKNLGRLMGSHGSADMSYSLPASYDTNSAYQYRGKTLSQLTGGA